MQPFSAREKGITATAKDHTMTGLAFLELAQISVRICTSLTCHLHVQLRTVGQAKRLARLLGSLHLAVHNQLLLKAHAAAGVPLPEPCQQRAPVSDQGSKAIACAARVGALSQGHSSSDLAANGK